MREVKYPTINLSAINPIFSLTTKQRNIAQYVLLGILSYLMLFVKLGSFHIRIWDESMFACNTYEMLQNGDYFALTYKGLPDLYNTKPPLTNWLQLLSVKAFGYNELAIRLPSAIAAFLTVIFTFKFTAKHFNYTWAWITALVLLTANGFIGFHSARGGDSDALLTLFLLLANISFINYLIYEKRIFIYHLFLFLTLAFCTKLFAALLFIPAYFILLVLYKKLKPLFSNYHFYLALMLFIGLCTALLFLRESSSPGYLATIFMNDAGRLFDVPAGYESSTLYYLLAFYESRFSTFFLLFGIGIAFILLKKATTQKQRILVTAFTLVSSYLLIITCSVTKLNWYDLPLYPFMALITAYPITIMLSALCKETRFKETLVKYSLIGLIFSYPFYYNFTDFQTSCLADNDKKIEANQIYLFNAINERKNIDGLKVLYQCYDAPLLFYKYQFAEIQQEITLHKSIAKFQHGDYVLLSKANLLEQLQDKFKVTAVDSYQYATRYLLESKKATQ